MLLLNNIISSPQSNNRTSQIWKWSKNCDAWYEIFLTTCPSLRRHVQVKRFWYQTVFCSTHYIWTSFWMLCLSYCFFLWRPFAATPPLISNLMKIFCFPRILCAACPKILKTWRIPACNSLKFFVFYDENNDRKKVS